MRAYPRPECVSGEASELMTMINEILGGKVKVIYSDAPPENHYTVTPYHYTPKAGTKLVDSQYVDMGQGILELVEAIDREN